MYIILILFTVSAIFLGNESQISLDTVSFNYDTIEMQITCVTQFWCLIGFGLSYSNSDMIRFNLLNGYVQVQDLLSQPSSVFMTPQIDQFQDVQIISVSQSSSSFTAIFQRRIKTYDLTDKTINIYETTPMIYMLGGSSDFSNYSQYGMFNYTFGQSSTCHYTCASCIGPSAQQCTQCQDSSRVLIDGYCYQYNNMSYPKAYENIISNQFVLYWTYDSNYVYMLFEMIPCSWFGLGFDGTQMNGTDMILFEVVDNQMIVHDMQGQSNKVPNDDTMIGGHQDWQIIGQKISSTLLQVKVKRKLKSQDSYDYDFSQRKDINALYAYGTNGSLMYHYASRGIIQLHLSQDDTQYNWSAWQSLVFRGHSILLFLFWGLLSDIGIFFARQLKSYPKYAKVHGTIFLFQALFTYVFVFAMIIQQQQVIQALGYQKPQIIAHFICGVYVLIAISLQLYLGFIVKNNLESRRGSERIFNLKLIHKISGYSLYIVTKVQVAIGMYIYQYNLLFWFYAYYLLLLLIKIIAELLYYFEISLLPRKRIQYQLLQTDATDIYKGLVERLNNNVPYQKMIKDYPRTTYVVLREAIYDVSDFNHPGGQFIFQQIKGREIGRYFYGGYPVQRLKFNPHTHSSFAINYIETRYIGDFRNESCPIIYKEEIIKLDDIEKHIWSLVEQRKLSSNAKLFTFQNSRFKIRQKLLGVQWFGRYFYIKPFAAGVDVQERPYSVVLCLSQNNIELRKQIIEYFKALVVDGTSHIEKPKLLDHFDKSLSFVIKLHSFSHNMSRFIHKTTRKRYEVTGPYGFGLELTKEADGVHYIICNGTGVLPFLDLFDFLIKKTIYTILQQKCGQDIANNVKFDQDFENTFVHTKFVLFGAFKNIEQFYGYPLALDLYYLCQEYGYSLFDMKLRFSTLKPTQPFEVSDKFDKEFFKTSLVFEPRKIYVCGSPMFEEQITQNLIDAGVNHKIISQI